MKLNNAIMKLKKILFTSSKAQRIGILGAVIFVFTLIFLTQFYPSVSKSNVKKKLGLKEGRRMREKSWKRTPFPIDTKFYIFNLTNANEVNNGEKPIIQEIGPYYYDSWEVKVDLVDHEEDDTVSYTPKTTWYFNAEKSHPLTGDEEVVVPNYFALSISRFLIRERPNMLIFLDKAFNSVFRNPGSLFMKTKVRNIAFDGLEINCNNVTGFGGTVLCIEIRKNWIPWNFIKIAENHYAYSFFGRFNGTNTRDRIRIKRGLKNVTDIGAVVEYNGKNNTDVWNNKYCDAFNGTDGTIFHPFFDKEGKEDVVIYNHKVCRSLNYRAENKSKFKGVAVTKYVSEIGLDLENNPDQECYCVKPNMCLKKGAYDFFMCSGTNSSLVYTSPHFYSAEEYLNGVIGLKPNEEEHSSYLLLEPFTGTTVYSHTRIQYNFFLSKVEKFEMMKNFPEALLPLFWCDRNLNLPVTSMDDIKFILQLHSAEFIIQIFVMLSGLAMMGWSGYTILKEKKAQMKLGTPDKQSMTGTSGKTSEKSSSRPAFSIS